MWPVVVVILATLAIVAALVGAFINAADPFDFWDEHEQN